MDFKEAMMLVREGKKVRKQSWVDDLLYIAQRKTEKQTQKEVRLYYKDEVIFYYPSEIVFSDEWKVIGGDESILLSFPEAIEFVLKQNAKIKLSEWKENTWIKLSDDKNNIILEKVESKPFELDIDDMIATDWELIGE